MQITKNKVLIKAKMPHINGALIIVLLTTTLFKATESNTVMNKNKQIF